MAAKRSKKGRNLTHEEIDEILDDVEYIKDKVIEKRPSHFSNRDIVNAFFGSLIIGITFILKGLFITTAEALSIYHVIAIILSTLLILTIEIYFIGYTRVKDKEKRPFYEFLSKRIFTLYLIACLTSLYLLYLFGANYHITTGMYGMFKMVVLLSMPCAIGAAVPSLLRQY